MRKSVFALLTGISLAAVAPAQAATFTNGDYSLNFNGISESYSLYPDPVPGLAATLDLTVSGAGTDSWTLVYKLSNLSDPSIWEKTRITALGFDVLSGGFTGGSVDGDDVFNKTFTPGGFPSLDGLGGDRNVCINGNPGGGACQGGGNAGPTTGNFITGTITLNFSSDLASLELDDGIIRWQSLDSEELGFSGDSGIGLVSEIPEPATWMTMIAGFGLIGMSLRRRRTAAQVLA
ncbi:hypothetical protein BSL82_00970 [Tardibacter chloracetimidivorans]|uniref:Ice-binding protein C-terminal domain-containing protein n=1 Tax=Tardibacter chloracetimidivorans TaxID=1921510 RepID=A0A1L3ZQZ6_9SPHN|nr:cistern family PEP-CTERM protein [Tardibacter chloracetimidivorans]API58045.1 hypothetical protein BSL82_00970 [Tardibacter chloracetimidivorans]